MAITTQELTNTAQRGFARSYRQQARRLTMFAVQQGPAEVEGFGTSSIYHKSDIVRLPDHGAFRVRSQSGGEPHDVCLVWFGDEQQPRIVCDITCKGGMFRKDERGSSICTHAIIVGKRLLRHPEEMTPPEAV